MNLLKMCGVGVVVAFAGFTCSPKAPTAVAPASAPALSIAPTAPVTSPAPSASVTPSAPLTSTGSANASGSACPERICERSWIEQGRCVSRPLNDRTRCPLNEAQYQAQIARYQHETTRKGVCWEGACIPRIQCAEQCGAPLGAEFSRKIAPRVAACKARRGDAQTTCLEEVVYQPSPERDAASAAILACMIRCGFPTLDELAAGRHE